MPGLCLKKTSSGKLAVAVGDVLVELVALLFEALALGVHLSVRDVDGDGETRHGFHGAGFQESRRIRG